MTASSEQLHRAAKEIRLAFEQVTRGQRRAKIEHRKALAGLNAWCVRVLWAFGRVGSGTLRHMGSSPPPPLCGRALDPQLFGVSFVGVTRGRPHSPPLCPSKTAAVEPLYKG
jgi:hypothetical protein